MKVIFTHIIKCFVCQSQHDDQVGIEKLDATGCMYLVQYQECTSVATRCTKRHRYCFSALRVVGIGREGSSASTTAVSASAKTHDPVCPRNTRAHKFTCELIDTHIVYFTVPVLKIKYLELNCEISSFNLPEPVIIAPLTAPSAPAHWAPACPFSSASCGISWKAGTSKSLTRNPCAAA